MGVSSFLQEGGKGPDRRSHLEEGNMRWRTLTLTVSRRLGAPVAAILINPPVWGADLPPHGPLRILITSDGVNPHGLPPELLVEPGDISEALSNPKTGLNIDKAPDSIVEIPTNQIELATEALSVSRCDPASYDVLSYFSHRKPNKGPPTGPQESPHMT